MRIISKQHDYYDGVIVSKDPVWIRNQESINYKKDTCDLNDDDKKYIYKMWVNSPSIPRNLIRDVCIKSRINKFDPYGYLLLGYCGRMIPVHILLNDDGTVYKCYSTIDEWVKACAEKYPKPRSYKSSNWRMRSYTFDFFDYDDIDSDEWKNVYGESTKTHDLFVKLSTPLFIIKKDTMIRNPCLKDFGVAGFLGDVGFTAQGIEQFLTNDLVSRDNPDCILDDVGKRDSHGFDSWSFKNTSTKKPRKKKRKS